MRVSMHRNFIAILLLLAAAFAFAEESPRSENAEADDAAAGGEPLGLDPEVMAFTSEPSGLLSISTDDNGKIEGTMDLSSFVATGNFRIAYGDTVISADNAVGSLTRKEVYVEGNVRMLTPANELLCDRAYVSWATGEAVFAQLDYRSREKTRQVAWFTSTPLGMRLADGTIVAHGSTISSCDYAVPHHYLRVRKLVVKANGDVLVWGVSYHILGVPAPFYAPIMYVPKRRPEIEFSAGNSSSFGTYARIDATVGLPLPLKPELTLTGAYYSKRRLGWGLGLDYSNRLFERGEAEYFTIPADNGEDIKGQELGTTHRYRYKWIHSMDSPDGWELDLELHKYSDAGFQKEFFEDEYFDDKEPENRLYLKRYENNWAAFIEGKIQLNEYLDTTERLPYGGIRGFSQPLYKGILWTSQTEFGFLRRKLSEIRERPGDTPASIAARRREWNAFQYLLPIRPDEELGEDRTTFRFHTQHEFSRPFPLGRLKLEPFAGISQTYYSRQLDNNNSIVRSQAFYGARLSTALYGVAEVRSRMLGIDGIRHILVPDISYVARTDTWGADADELIRFDELDDARQEDYVALRLQNVFQTRRAGRIVDLLELDLETDLYPHSNRDNEDERYSPLRIDARSHIIDGLSIFASADYDFSGEDEGLEFVTVGSRFDMTERWSAYVGQTYERGLDNYGSYALACRLTPKWTAVAKHERNWRTNDSLRDRFELIRGFHAFDLSISVENDHRNDEQTVGLSLSPRSIKAPPRIGSFVKKLAEERDERE